MSDRPSSCRNFGSGRAGITRSQEAREIPNRLRLCRGVDAGASTGARREARERLIVASDSGVEAVGKFDPRADSPVHAFGAFGTPTSIIDIDSSCEHEWSDLTAIPLSRLLAHQRRPGGGW